MLTVQYHNIKWPYLHGWCLFCLPSDSINQDHFGRFYTDIFETENLYITSRLMWNNQLPPTVHTHYTGCGTLGWHILDKCSSAPCQVCKPVPRGWLHLNGHSEMTVSLWIHLWIILLDLPGITMLSLLNVILSRNLVETSDKNCTAGNFGYVEGKSNQPLAYLLTTGIHYCKMDYPYYWYHIGVTVMENYMGFLFVFFTIFSQCITDSINKKLLLFEM